MPRLSTPLCPECGAEMPGRRDQICHLCQQEFVMKSLFQVERLSPAELTEVYARLCNSLMKKKDEGLSLEMSLRVLATADAATMLERQRCMNYVRAWHYPITEDGSQDRVGDSLAKALALGAVVAP